MHGNMIKTYRNTKVYEHVFLNNRYNNNNNKNYNKSKNTYSVRNGIVTTDQIEFVLSSATDNIITYKL